MTIHYNSNIDRFYSDETGQFVSESTARLSSVARGEYESFKSMQGEAEVTIEDLPFEPAYGKTFDSRLGDEQFELWGFGFEQGDIDYMDVWIDAYYDDYEIGDDEADKYEG